MDERSRLNAYHFYEQEWDSYDQLCESFEWEVPERFNAAEYVCDRWSSDKSRVALFGLDHEGNERTYTFWQLRNVTNRLANYLREQGVERGDRVGVNAPQKPETVMAHVAIWKLGAVSVPLSTLFGTEAVRYRLDDADAKACIVDASNAGALRAVRDDVDSLEEVLVVDGTATGEEVGFWDAIDASSRRLDPVDTAEDDDAIIIYTSGTTGDPKGVRHAHRVLLGNLPMFVTTVCNMEMSPGDVFWTPSEWAWVATLYDVVFPGLFFGKPVVAYENEAGFDPETAFDVIERYGVTNYFAPPTALRMMMQVDRTAAGDVGDVRAVSSGGESLGESIVEWAADTFDGAVVHEGYGQTEANMIVGDCTALTESREGKIGPAAPGHEVAIVDPETAEPTVDPGEVGEIAVRYEGDPICFKEYWNKPDKTAEKVQNGWLLTEDLGAMDADGYLSFHSRKDNVIISAGYRIGPVEIEEALATHDAVADAGVVGIPDDERGEVPKAFVVLAAGHEASDDLKRQLAQHVRDRLAKYEYPREIEFIDVLPTTSTGKVRRVDLEQREEQSE
ncbi:acyl-CoA synthetase [Halorarius halobius]|uniref:acyl-CoA synthetase n=1 Tax=Halorarius halobius TaxID=2962671 RepID=UPI0020CFB5D9|nr:AMP-binding protein [Halorarius halobius]